MPLPRSIPTTQSDVSKASSSKRKREDGRIFVGPKDPNFEGNILRPCKVEKIHGVPARDITPAAIFGEQSEILSRSAFLTFDEAELESIAEQFMEYERRGDNENDLGTLCANTILVREKVPGPLGPIQTISLRKDRWRPHKPGPEIQSNIYFFDWDVEPDVTYAVSINQFAPDLRIRLEAAPFNSWLAEDEASSPYLTIEYKCGEKGGRKSDALRQNVSASIIWLYQRRAMRQALQLSTADLRHYSIILLDGDFEIWEGRCKEDRFSFLLLDLGNMKKLRDLDDYVRWSNAIHTWGLGPNAVSFKTDVLELLKRSEDSHQLTPTSLEAAVHLPEVAVASSSDT
jgi:hypothetical protein